MKELLIRPVDVFEIVRRQKWVMSLGFLVTFALNMAFFVVVPRSYQSEVTLHVDVGYFQNPLIHDLVSQTHDPGELRSEREKLLQAALGVEFANSMGDKYKIFKYGADNPLRPVEVELFLKSLTVAPVTSTQFRIVYKHRNPEVADGVIRSAIETIRAKMYADRVEMLEQLLAVLSNEIGNAQGEGRGAGGRISSAHSEVGAEMQKNQVRANIESLESRLEDLQKTYNTKHPAVQAARSELAELRTIERNGGLTSNLTRRSVFGGGSGADGGGTTKLGQLTIRDSLNKQRHLVNMSLEMEKRDPSMSGYLTLTKQPVFPKKPVFPKLRLFILFGLVAGVLIATLLAALNEFRMRTLLRPRHVSAKLKIPVLGELVIAEK